MATRNQPTVGKSERAQRAKRPAEEDEEGDIHFLTKEQIHSLKKVRKIRNKVAKNVLTKSAGKTALENVDTEFLNKISSRERIHAIHTYLRIYDNVAIHSKGTGFLFVWPCPTTASHKQECKNTTPEHHKVPGSLEFIFDFSTPDDEDDEDSSVSESSEEEDEKVSSTPKKRALEKAPVSTPRTPVAAPPPQSSTPSAPAVIADTFSVTLRALNSLGVFAQNAVEMRAAFEALARVSGRTFTPEDFARLNAWMTEREKMQAELSVAQRQIVQLTTERDRVVRENKAMVDTAKTAASNLEESRTKVRSLESENTRLRANLTESQRALADSQKNLEAAKQANTVNPAVLLTHFGATAGK